MRFSAINIGRAINSPQEPPFHRGHHDAGRLHVTDVSQEWLPGGKSTGRCQLSSRGGSVTLAPETVLPAEA